MKCKKKVVALLGTLPLLCGCTTEIDLWSLNDADVVTFTASDFEYTKTRTNLDVTEAGVVFTWGEKDTVGIFPEEGAQAYFPMVSGAGTKKAAFTGGGWALKPSSIYAAYYPYQSGVSVTPDAVPVSYLGQKQTGNASTAHLGAYDYMAAVATTPVDGKVNFEFKHLGALVQLKIKMPAAGMLRKLTLTCEDAVFLSKGLLDIKAGIPSVVSIEKSNVFEVDLERVITTESDLTAIIYFMLPPTDLSGEMVKLKVLDTYGTMHTLSLEGMNFQAGKAYQWGGELDKYPDLSRVYHVETPGTLPQLVGEDNKYVITEMKVSGNLNGTDLRLIREMAGRDLNGYATTGVLMKLDLQESRIVEGGEAYLHVGGKKCYSKNDTIGEGLFGRTILTDIKLPVNLKSIEERAFESCNGLKSISIPNSVSTIGIEAFYSCKVLKDISLPQNLRVLGYMSFARCSSIEELTVPEGVDILGDYTFSECSSLKKITLSNDISSIGKECFKDCKSLQDIYIPERVELLGGAAFQGCSSLLSINIPEKVSVLDAYVFSGCASLNNVVIPESVEVIKKNAFYGCSSLTSIKIPNKVKAIPEACFFNCGNLREVQFPDSLVSLGASAFGFCGSLQKVDLPFTLTSIGASAFSRCASLERIALPGNITSVPSSIFSYCRLLQYTDILEGTIVVQNGLLSKIAQGTLVLPRTLQMIRENNLTIGYDEIYCYATTPPTVLLDNALSSECKVYVPDVSVNAYKAANIWSQGQILPLSEAK